MGAGDTARPPSGLGRGNPFPNVSTICDYAESFSWYLEVTDDGGDVFQTYCMQVVIRLIPLNASITRYQVRLEKYTGKIIGLY